MTPTPVFASGHDASSTTDHTTQAITGAPQEDELQEAVTPTEQVQPVHRAAVYADAHYLSAFDVKRIAHYGHWIPAGRGWTREFMEANWPGWGWGEIMTAIKRSGAYRPNEGHGGQLHDGYIGVLINRTESVADDGSLQHPLKDAFVQTDRSRFGQPQVVDTPPVQTTTQTP